MKARREANLEEQSDLFQKERGDLEAEFGNRIQALYERLAVRDADMLWSTLKEVTNEQTERREQLDDHCPHPDHKEAAERYFAKLIKRTAGNDDEPKGEPPSQ